MYNYTPTKGILSGYFTDEEYQCSSEQAIIRTTESRKQGLNPLVSGRNKYDPNYQYIEEFRGVLGELAVAKYFGIVGWVPTLNSFKEPDVLSYQVRASYCYNMRIFIRNRDHLNFRYIGTHINLNSRYFCIKGWVEGIWALEYPKVKPDKDNKWGKNSYCRIIPSERYQDMSILLKIEENNKLNQFKLEDYVDFKLFREWL